MQAEIFFVFRAFTPFSAKFFQRFPPELKRTFYCRKGAKKTAPPHTTLLCRVFLRKICSN